MPNSAKTIQHWQVLFYLSRSWYEGNHKWHLYLTSREKHKTWRLHYWRCINKLPHFGTIAGLNLAWRWHFCNNHGNALKKSNWWVPFCWLYVCASSVKVCMTCLISVHIMWPFLIFTTDRMVNTLGLVVTGTCILRSLLSDSCNPLEKGIYILCLCFYV